MSNPNDEPVADISRAATAPNEEVVADPSPIPDSDDTDGLDTSAAELDPEEELLVESPIDDDPAGGSSMS